MEELCLISFDRMMQSFVPKDRSPRKTDYKDGRLKTGMKLDNPSDLGSQDFVVAIKVVVAFPINVCGESMLWLCRLCGRDEQEPNKSGRKVYAKQKWLKSNCGT